MYYNVKRRKKPLNFNVAMLERNYKVLINIISSVKLNNQVVLLLLLESFYGSKIE